MVDLSVLEHTKSDPTLPCYPPQSEQPFRALRGSYSRVSACAVTSSWVVCYLALSFNVYRALTTSLNPGH